MPKTKRKFIDKKNSVTFRLSERPSNDPLLDFVNAPQSVLALVNSSQSKSTDVDRWKIQKKYGIEYEDDYDYTKHLFTRQNLGSSSVLNEDEPELMEDGASTVHTVCSARSARLMLPNDVFSYPINESAFENNDGLEQFYDIELEAALNEAESKLAPDEGDLEDNFIELADELIMPSNAEDAMDRMEDSKTDLLRRFFGVDAVVDVLPNKNDGKGTALDLLTSKITQLDCKDDDYDEVEEGQFSDAESDVNHMDDLEEDDTTFLAKEAAFLGRTLTVREQIDLLQYRSMLREVEMDEMANQVTDVDRQSAASGSVCSLATRQAMERDRSVLFSRDKVSLEPTPEEAAELLDITYRLLEAQSDTDATDSNEEESNDVVNQWANADRRVELEHDIESYHDARKLAALRKTRSGYVDELMVPNNGSGDRGVIVRSSNCSRNTSQCSNSRCDWREQQEKLSSAIQLQLRLVEKEDEEDSEEEEADSISLAQSSLSAAAEKRGPHAGKETPEERRLRKANLKALKRERLVVRRERREAFQEARRLNRPLKAPGITGLQCRLVPLSDG